MLQAKRQGAKRPGEDRPTKNARCCQGRTIAAKSRVNRIFTGDENTQKLRKRTPSVACEEKPVQTERPHHRPGNESGAKTESPLVTVYR